MIKGLNTLLYGKLLLDDTEQPNGNAVYEPPKKLSGAIEIKPKLNQNNAELYSDDMLVDSDYSVSSVGLTLTVDDDDDDIFCPLIGMTPNGEGENPGYDASVYDESAPIGLGYIEVKGNGKFRVKFYPNAKVKPFDSDAKTKEEKVTFQKTSIEVIASPLKNGMYKHQKTFLDSKSAVEYLKYLFTSGVAIIYGIQYDEPTKTLIIPNLTYDDDSKTIISHSMHFN